jgi:holo-[acyl-carrier protein] synthase
MFRILQSPRWFAKISENGISQISGRGTMEIVGIGTDIVECLRIGRIIERHGEIFLTRVYTEREIRYCRERKRATEHFAGRWAAKEAILKCLGTGWSKGISWTDMEIRNDAAGQPRVLVCGAVKDIAQKLHIADILVSISHCRSYATAHAIAVSVAASSPPAERKSPPP